MKKKAKKAQKAALVAVITVFVIAALFILRTYLADRYGIFAARYGEQVHSIVSVANGKVSEGASKFENAKIVGSKVVLDNVEKPGTVEGWITNYQKSTLTRFVASAGKPTGCSGGKATLKVKFCEYTGGEYQCDTSWRTNNSTSYAVTESATPTYVRFRVELEPCSGGGGA